MFSGEIRASSYFPSDREAGTFRVESWLSGGGRRLAWLVGGSVERVVGGGGGGGGGGGTASSNLEYASPSFCGTRREDGGWREGEIQL